MDSWRYRVTWRRLSESAGRLTGTWLAVVPPGVPANVTALLDGLRAQGADIVMSRPSGDVSGVLAFVAFDAFPHSLTALTDLLSEPTNGPLWVVTMRCGQGSRAGRRVGPRPGRRAGVPQAAVAA
ncbi:hypothetical protein [Kutzneria sp. 744]|uniref:hypothetical protein n=1 Tax=Kutzneria sp. (strain 744) TaxID=345341 RepID=UPI00069344DC|nr:hypothetical protein [Kutzneria sp. 744]